MPSIRRLCLGILVTLALMAESAMAENPFGIMLWPGSQDDLSLLAARARGLGVAWFRPPAVFLDRWKTGSSCAPCASPARAGLKVALTVRNGGRDYAPRRPSTAPGDPEGYKRTLASVLDVWKPDILVVENEENNPQFYQAGTTGGELAAAYLRELTLACGVAHAKGVACANGGLSGDAAAAITWLALLERGPPETACDFAKRAFYDDANSQTGGKLCIYQTPAQVPAALTASLLREADLLLPVYRSAPIDRVNIHWYGHDAGVFANVASVLSRATGKPVMSNEIGQWRWDADPIFVRPLLRAAFAAGINPAIWFSIDTPATVSLFNEDGSLRPGGKEFTHQMSGRK
ncbi:hypothetical protein [Telmatospirillum sp.]|uniref:hypothetical protein n=1 Tax=Telmatospirillum sp. TaxID=2079197 RepID=UPI0028435D44|nr:hypothetical protein [Telmatospirillum sp.]MDR3436068.1 hypothetical protein [Telmatospirillum sp.]